MIRIQSRNDRIRKGTSLVEVLVVMVVFLVGILAVVQIYPKGLSILKTSRSSSVAVQLARAELERLKGQSDQIAEAILPVRYVWDSATSRFNILVDLDKRPNDLAPLSAGIDANGIMLDANNQKVDAWPFLTSANVMRHVVGEGRTIPAPRFLSYGGTQFYGSLMTLQFAPIVNNTQFNSPLLVYGNDLDRNIVDEINGSGGDANNPGVGDPIRRQDSTVLVDEDGTTLAIPQGPYRADNPAFARTFRVAFSYIAKNTSGNYESRTIIVPALKAPSAQVGQWAHYWLYDLAALTADADFVHAEIDTVRVQRAFDLVATPADFLNGSQVVGNDGLYSDAAFQVLLYDRTLGMLAFNSAGFNYRERRRQGRVPLRARVDYDVLDWRILREDFRIAESEPYQHKLTMSNLKVLGNLEPDNRPYKGMGFDLPLSANTRGRADFALVDIDTGAVLLPVSYQIDKSAGIVTFIDGNGNPGDGLQAYVMYPGATTRSLISIAGRSVRALFQANGEWAVQTVKAAQSYTAIYNQTLGFGQCYLGGSNTVGTANRIYFPLSDIGKSVVVGEVWYLDNTGTLQVMRDQEFLIQPPRAGDLQLGFVELTQKDPNAVSFDYSNGYSVRRVRGASVGVRVSWNPTSFSLGADPVKNLEAWQTWTQSSRRNESTTFLTRGDSTP